jgi:LacI family transcriptional regulator
MEDKPTDTIRIKDIAQQAGVSMGTVDRVLHGRPNVSAESRRRVEEVLQRINYKPNMYASALSTNKNYCFACLLPKHKPDSTWNEVENGIEASVKRFKEFHLSAEFIYYNQFDDASFRAAGKEAASREVDGVVLMPQEPDPTADVCALFEEKGMPYTFVDTNYGNLNALAFYGQDPIPSGYFTARIFMMQARGVDEVFIFSPMSEGRVTTKQVEYREVGFRQYMKEYFPDTRIELLRLTPDSKEENYRLFDSFFSTHPHVKHGITFGSRAYMAGDYLARTNRRDIRLTGYDALARNIDCLHKGTVSFIIGQHSWAQGYCCIHALFDHLVLHKEVNKTNYMPIELLSTENIDYYRKQMF